MNLNLPPFELMIKKQHNKHYVFDRLRKQFTRLTAEEYVRQNFINYLIEYKSYSEALMANEVMIEVGNLKKRCDTVLYDNLMNPVLIIEYKSPSVRISQETFDQIVMYNSTLRVPWLIVSNGLEHFCCRIDYENINYQFKSEIPHYNELADNH